MIKAIIIDDEQHCINALLHDLAGNFPEIQVMCTCLSAAAGMEAIKHYKPTVIFLDIEMPVMNGFEMLNMLRDEISFQVVFITAFDQFAAKAFRLSAVDYLLKPVAEDELRDAIRRVKNKIKAQTGQSHVSELLRNLSSGLPQQRIAFPHKDGYEFIELGEIIYCKADGAYTQIFLSSSKRIMVSRSLGEVTENFPPELFERIHHSFVINIHHVRQFLRRDGASVTMSNGDELPVSRSRKDTLLSHLGIR